MGTTVRLRTEVHRPGKTAGKRVRRRWRFNPRGFIGLVFAILILINLYILADNVVRLVRQNLEEKARRERLAEMRKSNNVLQRQRNWMLGKDFLREQAHSLGYVSSGESVPVAAEEVPPQEDGVVKKRPKGPSQPY